MAKRNGEDSGDTGKNSGELVPQGHGGALKRGGNWGNKGGGREPIAKLEHIRDLSIKELERRLDGDMMTRDVISLAALATRHTVPVPKSAYDADLVDELWAAMEVVLNSRPDADEIALAIKKVWAPILVERVKAVAGW
tara:strand:+ start:1556 stop:1969 length:414 start_codon:yes stop_codon:yes gene_type:complete